MGLAAGLLVVAAVGCAELKSRWPSRAGAPETPAGTPAKAPAEARRTAPPPAEPAAHHLPPGEAEEVGKLLNRAEVALAEDHLTYPSQGSALALYERVMLLDRDNDEARRGLERIVERYLELALKAFDQRRYSQATAMLDRARLVDPDHPGIAPTEAQIRMLTDAERRVIELDGRRLRDQDPVLTVTLRQAGLASREDGCRAQIVARNDSEGRWIYQQMSEAPGDARIRAQLDIGSPPRIEVLCFPEP